MKKSYLKYALHIAIIIGLVIAGFKYLSGQEVLRALKSFDYSFAMFILAASTGYVLIRAWRFVVLTRPYTGILWNVIFRAYVAGQAAALMPGGIAAQAGLLKQADVPVSKGSVPVFLSSGLDQVVLISGALIAALWFGRGQMQILFIIGIVTFFALLVAIPATRRGLNALALHTAQCFNIEKQWQNFVKAWPKVFTGHTMSASLGLTIAAFAFHLIALDLTVQGMKQDLAFPALALVYILPTVLGRLSGLPGGFGVTEAGMVGFMTAVSDIGTDSAIAIATIFRIATILFSVVLGAFVYIVGWRGEDEAAAPVS